MRFVESEGIELSDEALDRLVVKQYPYPIAVNYRRLLALQGWEERTRKCLQVFEYGMRAVTLNVLSQYLIRDVHRVSEPVLDRKLHSRMAQASLGQWVEFFFLSLRAYHGKRELFFTPEMYDLYWDTSREPHRERRRVRGPFDRLVQIRNDLAHRLPPKDEASWEALGTEAMGHLRAVLRQFHFLQHYDLIRVVDRRGSEYEYERYMGQTITSHCEELEGEDGLRMGWFYLSRRDRCVLELHPLLIAWMEEGEVEPRDVAMYDRLMKEAVEYVALAVQKMVEERDAELLALFQELIHNLEHFKLARRKTMLSWEGLRWAAGVLTAEQMETLREKHRAGLYLQREATLGEFRDFLASGKGCLVLTGKSGVGKSNFVLSLVDEFAEREDVGLVIYNAARLRIPGTALEKLSQDLGRHLTLRGEAPEALFGKLRERGELTSKTLIVVFDALNENEEGKGVLQKIDRLVGDGGHPWLKVVITSRPAAWHRLARGLPLAGGRYYRGVGQEGYLSGEQELVVKLEPFGFHELEAAYANYRREYSLQNEFGSLRPAVVQALRDPLILRLVAEIHEGQMIPEDLQVSEIHDRYVEMLQRTGRLFAVDLELLKRDLMPLMIAKGHYENKVTAAQISSAQTSDDRPLWELIYSDDILSDGSRVNESFERLVDTEILVGQGTALDYEISFKYERFYDYLGGERLYELYKRSADVVAFFEALIEAAREKPFLLGVIQNALQRDLEAGRTETILGLCSVVSAEVRDMAATALISYGEEHRERVRPLLDTLLPTRTPLAELSDRDVNAGLVALSVGGYLGVPEVLARGVRSSSPVLRTEAVRQTCLLWSRDRQKGWGILDGLIEEILETLWFSRLVWQVVRKKARFDLLESAGWISAYILVYHYAEEGIAGRLQQKWRPVIARVLFYRGDRSRWDRAVGRARELILSTLVDVVVGRLSKFPSRYNPTSPVEMRGFYKLPQRTRKRAFHLANYLDPSFGEWEELESLINELYPTQNSIINLVIGHSLVARGRKEPLVALRIMRDLFFAGVKSSKPGIINGDVIWFAITLAGMQEQVSDEIFEAIRELMFAATKDVKDWHSPIRTYSNVWFDDYARFYVKKYGSSKVDVLEWQAKRALDENDVTAMIDMLSVVGRLINSSYWRVVTEVIKILAPAKSPEVRDKIVDLLARIRARHKEFVDGFLEQYLKDSEIRRWVLVRSAQEELIDTIGGGSGPWADFIVDIMHSDEFRQDLVWIARTVTRSNSFNQALKITAKWGINKIYGEEIFPFR